MCDWVSVSCVLVFVCFVFFFFTLFASSLLLRACARTCCAGGCQRRFRQTGQRSGGVDGCVEPELRALTCFLHLTQLLLLLCALSGHVGRAWRFFLVCTAGLKIPGSGAQSSNISWLAWVSWGNTIHNDGLI